jgi:outer membrane protein TolC
MGTAILLLAMAQPFLTLHEAAKTALERHPAIRMAQAGESQAAAKVTQAKAGYLPRLDYLEQVERGNNPVYVFGSLLTQHQFTASNFNLGTLNRPDAVTNFRSALLLEQMVFDGGRTRLSVHAADLGQQAAAEQNRRTQAEVILGAVQAYAGAVLAASRLTAAEDAVQTAQADLRQAQARRAAGLITEADVLAIQVHLAAMEERRIRAASDLAVARAALNQAMGQPLDTPFDLPATLDPARAAPGAFETLAMERPEARQTELAWRAATAARDLARKSYWPQISLRSGFEVDRQAFVSRGGANWIAGLTLRFNVFNGHRDKAGIAEAAAGVRAAEAGREHTQTALRLEARRASLGMAAAEQRIRVAAAIVEQAAEAHRIIRDRYDAGLATVTELLRAATALLDARTQRLTAIHEQRVAAAQLEFAAGRLTLSSEVLQ